MARKIAEYKMNTRRFAVKVVPPANARVAIIMGSDSDMPVMEHAAHALQHFGIPFEVSIVSAHRTPVQMAEFARTASDRGLRVIIAGAGGAAHLPGMVAAHSELPVIGVPVPVGHLGGEDALLSIVQMPKGVPVATVAIGGSWNAGVLAAQILAAGGSEDDPALLEKLRHYKGELEDQVALKNRLLTRARSSRPTSRVRNTKRKPSPGGKKK